MHGFDTWPAYVGAKPSMRYEVRVEYTGKENGQRYREVHVLDVGSLEHRLQFRRKDLDDLVKQTEKLTRVLEDAVKAVKEHQQLTSALRAYSRDPALSADDQLADLVSLWRAANRIDEDNQARFWWEPARRALLAQDLSTYRALGPTGSPPELRVSLERAMQLLNRPLWATDDGWGQELGHVMERLQELRPAATSRVDPAADTERSRVDPLTTDERALPDDGDSVIPRGA